MADKKRLPLCMRLIADYITPTSQGKALYVHQFIILGLTFLSYTSYHMTRKSWSIVKTVLHQNCSEVSSNVPHNSTTWCDFPPFDGDNSAELLSALDSAFLFSYATSMFISGFIAERVNLRYFLSFGMLASAVFCFLLGLANLLEIHSLVYFVIVQIFFGIFQTTGWPAVVAICGHWFGRSKRGLIFGIWNSHTSIGNIIGTVIASAFVETKWAYSFFVPAAIMAFVGLLMFVMIVVHPEDLGLAPITDIHPQGINVAGYVAVPSTEDVEDSSSYSEGDAPSNRPDMNESSPILHSEPDRAIGFFGALAIPGVIEFSLALFFAKLVSYTFLFWLPSNIVQSTDYGPKKSSDLSTTFDVGGIIGAIAAGYISDKTEMPASTCVLMLVASIPALFLYEIYSTGGQLAVLVVLLLIAGAFVNGPYALITTSVSAELGTHESLNGNAKATATVTAIIDGTGSIGAAVGPLLAGLVSSTGWDNVFYFLIGSSVCSMILLTRLTYWEIKKWRRRRRQHSS